MKAHRYPAVARRSRSPAAASPALAHHSFAAEYDDQKPLKITGTLTKVDWMNPHIWALRGREEPRRHGDARGRSRAARPGQLMRRGITRDLLVVGSTVNVEGFRAKDGSNNGFGQRVTYQDGRNVFTATDPAGRAPQR